MLQSALTWIIHFPDLILDVFCIDRDVKMLKEYAQKPFVCPNCGKKFLVKWHQLWFGRGVSLAMVNKAKLKCPHCKTTDFCRWTGKDT